MKNPYIIAAIGINHNGRIKDIKKGFVLDDDGERFSFNGIMGVVNLLVTNGYEIAFIYNEEDDSVNYIMEKVK